MVGQVIEQIAQAPRRAEYGGRGRGHFTEAAQHLHSARESHQRITVAHLESSRHGLLGQRDQRRRIGAQGLVALGRQCAAGKQREAGHAQAFRAGQLDLVGLVDVAPVRTGARIQQHARDHQVDPGAGALAAVQTGARRQLLPALDAACPEMPPAAVIRHRQVRIVQPDRIGHIGSDLLQPLRMPGEMAGCGAFGPRHDLRTLAAHRLRGQQPCGRMAVWHWRMPAAIRGDHPSFLSWTGASVHFSAPLARVQRGFRAACCSPAERSAHAGADAPCKGDDVLPGGATPVAL